MPAQHNGNGKAIALAEDFNGLPPWMAAMRAAAANAISANDVQEIVKAQVERAKKGDQSAIKFVFEMLLGGSLKAPTLIQNNFMGDDPRKPTDAIPGTKDKLDVIERRIRAGLPSDDPRDRSDVNLD